MSHSLLGNHGYMCNQQSFLSFSETCGNKKNKTRKCVFLLTCFMLRYPYHKISSQNVKNAGSSWKLMSNQFPEMHFSRSAKFPTVMHFMLFSPYGHKSLSTKCKTEQLQGKLFNKITRFTIRLLDFKISVFFCVVNEDDACSSSKRC